SEESGEDAGEFLRVPHCEAATPFLMAFILADFSFAPSGACSSFSFDSHACAVGCTLAPLRGCSLADILFNLDFNP
ncbi:MAG: hypothetical protein WB781_14930, partial [Candidatus Sulfotelmatobacter sp.]